ncbi:ricin-type beta-trefoil lectin domain protein [Micromonospora sp. WMMD1082]|uniref:ricin-type beta-trefoil lectin domain protein n=1 Tax=Micromonospora sp. WMMD1082 TaxID=3016104 RepID=UPI00241649A9|nr:ricin-type beta-trefoil lectin domain protein [Micromonospora sp. WMMD1082]MDG4797097.1 ricin-type beta-trefoil lectin domain protein [Micromonospora sp. WMMD1082]
MHVTTPEPFPTPRRRSAWRLLVSLLSTLILVPVVAVSHATPASANTSQFRGMNWARLGDNFTTGTLVLDGLSSSDSYATVRAKANAIYTGMENHLGVNTVRLPVNTHTVSSSWWSAYRGTIDAATERGFKVILTYWEDGASSGGRITNMGAFNSMWDTVISQYGANSRVYFEPMNEPHGYSESEWMNVAANWINARSSVPRGRIFVSGTGYNTDLRPVCNDSRFSGTLLSYHHYAFMFGENDYAGWRNSFETRLGSCASRAVLTEFGGPMDTGLNYHNASSTDNFVRHIRAVTDSMRARTMGSVYWPALGGKVTSGQTYDWYSMFARQGSGTNITLSVRNPSGADRVRHGWGDGSGAGPQVTSIVNRNSGKCLDVVSASTANNADIIQWDCHSGANQRWQLQPVGGAYYQIVSQHSGRCLDVASASTANNARVAQYDCHSGTNQQWELRSSGGYTQIVARHSGKCLDVISASTENGTRIQQYDCYGGTNQHWTL